MNQYGALARSVMEALLLLFISQLMAPLEYATYTLSVYIFYIAGNLVFSSATVDYSGGIKRTNTSGLISYTVLFCIPFVLGFDMSVLGFCKIMALLSIFEAFRFVQSEVTKDYQFIRNTIKIRALSLIIILLAIMFYDKNLYVVAILMCLRDIALLIYALINFKGKDFFYLKNIQFKNCFTFEFLYIFLGNSFDHIIRYFVNYTLGAMYLARLEWIMRIPRALQMVLFLLIRQHLFTGQNEHSISLSSNRILIVNVLLFTTTVVPLFYPLSEYTYIVASAVFLTISVSWYTRKLSNRKFKFLCLLQIFLTIILLAALYVLDNLAWSFMIFSAANAAASINEKYYVRS